MTDLTALNSLGVLDVVGIVAPAAGTTALRVRPLGISSLRRSFAGWSLAIAAYVVVTGAVGRLPGADLGWQWKAAVIVLGALVALDVARLGRRDPADRRRVLMSAALWLLYCVVLPGVAVAAYVARRVWGLPVVRSARPVRHAPG